MHSTQYIFVNLLYSHDSLFLVAINPHNLQLGAGLILRDWTDTLYGPTAGSLGQLTRAPSGKASKPPIHTYYTVHTVHASHPSSNARRQPDRCVKWRWELTWTLPTWG